MCGRFYTNMEREEIARVNEAVRRAIRDREIMERVKTGEIKPTDVTAVYAALPDGIAPAPMQWGFPGYAKPGSKAKPPVVINARSETVLDKPMFAQYVQKRCLVPANLYFEWVNLGGKKKQKNAFRPVDASMETFWMAAIFREVEAGVPVFTILTMAASESVAPVHDRMPVILGRREARRAWMGGERDLRGLIEAEAVREIAHEPCKGCDPRDEAQISMF